MWRERERKFAEFWREKHTVFTKKWLVEPRQVGLSGSSSSSLYISVGAMSRTADKPSNTNLFINTARAEFLLQSESVQQLKYV